MANQIIVQQGQQPINIPDYFLEAVRKRVANGEDINSALKAEYLPLFQQFQDAGGVGGLGGQVAERLGFGTGYQFDALNAYIDAGKGLGYQGLVALVNNTPPPTPGGVTTASTPAEIAAAAAKHASEIASMPKAPSNPSPAVYPKGTVLRRDDGVTFVADGTTQYGPSYKATGEYSSSAPGPVSAGNPLAITTPPSGTGGAGGVNVNAANAGTDKVMADFLANSNLTTDQKNMVQAIYDAVSTKDASQAARIQSAFQAVTQYSDPYFKAQALIVTDALSRALGGNEGDLGYQEEKLRSTLDDLNLNIANSKDYLSFNHLQDLQKLARSYEKDLEDTRTNLAATGKTSSSVRAQAEDLLRQENQGLVESTNRQYGYQTSQLVNQEQQGQRDYSRDLAYITNKAAQDRIAKLREAESNVGSTALQNLGYSDLLGNIPGELERKKALDALSFSNSFVF